MKYIFVFLFPLMMFSQETSFVGDVDCSGDITSQDAVLILQYVTSVIDELPCESNMTGLTPEQLQEIIDMMDEQLSINYTVGSGGGCDYFWPDGLYGNPIQIDLINSNYEVPTGKNLYIISSFYKNGSPPFIQLNSKRIFQSTSSNLLNVTANQPLIIKSGDILSSESENNTEITVIGLLINQSVTEPILIDLLNSNYTVPDGKNLHISSSFYKNGSPPFIQLNSKRIFQSTSSNLLNVTANQPLIIKSGDILSSESENNTEISILGYLVDEDYFDNCSGGGANNLVNPQNNNGVSNSNTLMYTIDGF